MEMEILQETDLKILDAIKHHARKSYEQIAKEVGISRTAVKNRMEAMKESGVIVGYETITRRANAKQSCRFLVDVETSPRDFESVKNLLGQSPFIKELYVTAGNCHLHAVGVASNQQSLQGIVNRLQREFSDVRRLGIYTILSVCKDVDGGVEYEQKVQEEDS